MQSEKRKNIIKKCIQDQFPNLLFSFENEEKDENIIFHVNTVHNGVSVNIPVCEDYSWNEIKQRIGNALINDETCHICFETIQNAIIGCKCTLKMCFDCYKKIDPENGIFKCPVCKTLSKYMYSLEFFKRLTIYQFQEYELLRFQQLLMEEESYKLFAIEKLKQMLLKDSHLHILLFSFYRRLGINLKMVKTNSIKQFLSKDLPPLPNGCSLKTDENKIEFISVKIVNP